MRLRKDLAASLRAGHPWVYRDALAPGPCPPGGAVVDVADGAGCFIGRGLYDAGSPIAVRIYTLDPEEAVDAALLRRRLMGAITARRGAVNPETTDALRLCHGEGDFLPGVVIDLYAGVAVVRFDGQAAQVFRDEVFAALGGALAGSPFGPLRALYERTPGRPGQLLGGELPPGELVVREHGVRLVVDVVHGQKTGHFLDMRENRLLIRHYARDLVVWNGFCYTGGFSLQAALGGARCVISVDSAAPAVAAAERNFCLNGLDPAQHEFVCADAFASLRQARAAGLRHGLVIADPPSFAPSQGALGKALGAYRDLFTLTMGVVAPGGILAAGSCSSHVDQAAFLKVLGEAAVAAQRRLRLLEVRGQPADHPSLPAFPEGRYLKFVLGRLD